MMKFTPKYTVSYHGAFHEADKPFEIDAKDADEMSAHGIVEAAKETDSKEPKKQPK